jgi:hypothetical protein
MAAMIKIPEELIGKRRKTDSFIRSKEKELVQMLERYGCHSEITTQIHVKGVHVIGISFKPKINPELQE